MRLFFKHLIRDAARFPVQIVLIILTLSVSVCVGVGSFKAQRIFIERAHWLADTESEMGDIVLTPGSSDMRMIFDCDVEALLSPDDRMLGEFKISALTKDSDGKDFVASVVGSDLEAADLFFEFTYVQYGAFTTENINSSAIVSKSAAEEMGKGIGDTVTLTVLDHELDFTVQAIAENEALFKECDVMIPITSLRRALAEHVPALALLGEAFTPYTRISVKLGDVSDADGLLQKIRLSENLRHCGIEQREISSTLTDMRILAQTGSVFLISSVLIILCILLCLTCLRLLESKRRQDYALFSSCGATETQINAMRIGETLLYSLVGAAIGIPASRHIIDWVCSLVLLPDKEYTVGLDGAAFGIALSVALSLLCTVIHIIKLRSDTQSERIAFEETERKRGLLPALALLLSDAALIILALVIENEMKAVVCSAIIFVTVIFAVVYAPTLSKAIAGQCARLIEKRGLGRELLVFRAIENNYSLRHIGMILTVSVTLIISIGMCQSAVHETLSLINGGIRCENVVLNSDAYITAHIKEEFNADNVCEMKVFSDAILNGEHVVFALSAYGDTDSLLSDKINVKLPEGRRIVISKPIARLCHAQIGDTVSVTLNGNEYALEVSDIIPNKAVLVFFDARALGIRPDMCAFDVSQDGFSDENDRAICEYLELNGATLTTPDAVFGRASKTGQAFIQIIRNALYASVVLTLVGTVNSAISSYHRRKREFEILSLCGMPRSQRHVRVLSELVCVSIVALLLAVPLLALSIASLEMGASSFGLTLF